jgi:hypothetical protein
MNYYQEANQPEITQNVHVFDTLQDLRDSVGDGGFRCPNCGEVSTDPYECGSGAMIEGDVCNWKAYGLLRTAGSGAYIFVKSEMQITEIFMPMAWESERL